MSDATNGLSGSGLQFWDEVTSTYGLRVDEKRILEDACRMMCLIDRLEASVNEVSMFSRGSQGQEVINPLYTELRQQRAGLAKLLGQLKLPDVNSGGGEGTGTTPVVTAAEAARQLANARWGTA